MRLVLISPPVDHPREHLILNALFERGLQAFHLRKPCFTSEVQTQVYLAGIPKRHLGRVVVHQHHSLAAKHGLKGIHFRERDREGGAIEHKRGLTMSTSIHSTSAHKLPACGAFSYVFLSPVFNSISKEGYQCAFPDREELRKIIDSSACPVYALGGITAGTLPEVHWLGFKGAAMLGGIWEAPDPVTAFEEAAAVCDGLEGG